MVALIKWFSLQKARVNLCKKSFMRSTPGVGFIMFFGINLFTLFSKLDPFTTSIQILFTLIKWSSFQKKCELIYTKRYMRSTSGDNEVKPFCLRCWTEIS